MVKEEAIRVCKQLIANRILAAVRSKFKVRFFIYREKTERIEEVTRLIGKVTGAKLTRDDWLRVKGANFCPIQQIVELYRHEMGYSSQAYYEVK